jgi:transmembrane sensor
VSSPGHSRINRQINEEAAYWFVEFRTGDIDTAGRTAFDAWVRASPEHLRAFIEIAALWGHSGSLDRQGLYTIEELVASAREEVNVVPYSGRSRAEPDLREHSRRLWPAAAAAALVAVGLMATWFLRPAGPIYSTEVGERRSLRLADGSVVTLNSRSRVRVEFNDSTRTVDLLNGEALFRVAREASRPFLVRAAGTFVRAVGTEFDVDQKDHGTVITVVDGRVAVSRTRSRPDRGPIEARPAEEEAVFVSGGERIDTAEGANPSPTRVNAGSATAWTQGKIILQSATLAEVVESFNRYSQRRLIATDQGGTPFRLSGVFSTDPDFLIRYLRERADIEVQESATEIRIVHTGTH